MVILNKDVEIDMPLKYFSNFWTNLLMPLIDFEIDFILICSATDSTGAGLFKVTDTKTLRSSSKSVNSRWFESIKKLKLWLNRTINGNIYEPKGSTETQNQYFDYLIDPRFEVVNTLFELAF